MRALREQKSAGFGQFPESPVGVPVLILSRTEEVLIWIKSLLLVQRTKEDAGIELLRGNKRIENIPHKTYRHTNPIEKWSPFRAPALWDPIRELEDMQNRLSSLLGRRLPLLRDGGEEEFTVTEWWSPPVDIAEDEKEYRRGLPPGLGIPRAARGANGGRSGPDTSVK